MKHEKVKKKNLLSDLMTSYKICCNIMQSQKRSILLILDFYEVILSSINKWSCLSRNNSSHSQEVYYWLLLGQHAFTCFWWLFQTKFHICKPCVYQWNNFFFSLSQHLKNTGLLLLLGNKALLHIAETPPNWPVVYQETG